MRVKRFDNLWTMGLIIFGVLLVVFYLAKMIFPSFVVGVAETPNIVKFGEFVDKNILASFVVNTLTSYLSMFLYTCACCRIKNLSKREHSILFCNVALAFVVQSIYPSFSIYYNFLGYVIMPMLICLCRKNVGGNAFYSTCACYIINILAQCISLEIRGIYSIISYPNTATYLILLIDLYIWNFLLYSYFNFKKGE